MKSNDSNYSFAANGPGRMRARADLPTGVPRLQPRRVVARLQTSWAVNLAGRVGWHGVRTTTASIVVPLTYKRQSRGAPFKAPVF